MIHHFLHQKFRKYLTFKHDDMDLLSLMLQTLAREQSWIAQRSHPQSKNNTQQTQTHQAIEIDLESFEARV